MTPGKYMAIGLVVIAGLGIWAGLSLLTDPANVDPRDIPDPLAPPSPTDVIAENFPDCNVQSCQDPEAGFYIDCGTAFDGPAYFADASGQTLATCGGACMTPDGCDRELCSQLWQNCGI